MKTLMTFFAAFLIILTLSACAKTDESDQADNQQGSEAVYVRISGNSALGRPGSWSNNCVIEFCARADNEGNYLVSAEVAESALMWSDIPEADGSNVRLYSRYRHDESVTSVVVNVNPTTNAIMDAWSYFNQGQSIDSCALSDICINDLLANFSVETESTMISQLGQLLGNAWPYERNPFEDSYTANPNEDWLDDLHDHLQFIVTADNLAVFDNNGTELTNIPIRALLNAGDPVWNTDTFTLQDTAVTDAFLLTSPLPPSGSPITLSIRFSPSSPFPTPTEFSVNVSQSTSTNPGDLNFTHELTRVSGFTETFSGERVMTTITEGGSHTWVVIATDQSGAQLISGFELTGLVNELEEPTFGGDGSCSTPAPLTANSQNICEETLNGGSLGVCEAISSGSINLVYSPAPCATETQNDGQLLGMCTIVENEIKIFHYLNPERQSGETIEEQQARVQLQCINNLLGDWTSSAG